ncbi:MAG: hypothetical protein MJA83_04620 [Gammaproteobacteria bacterium]|nr:hypothetical protein [Gammaproteobacteria bacterium]
MERLIIVFLGCFSIVAGGCATSPQSYDESLSAPIDAPGQFGEIRIGRDNFMLSQGVVDIVDKESELDVTGKDTRVKCTRRYRTGSHRIIRVCRTVVEIDKDTRRTRDDFERLQRMGKIRVNN